VLWQRAVRVGVGWRLVRVRDVDVPPSKDLPVCRFQRDGRVLQKREDQSVSGAILSLVQSVHRAGGGGAAGPGSEQSRAEMGKRGRRIGGAECRARGKTRVKHFLLYGRGGRRMWDEHSPLRLCTRQKRTRAAFHATHRSCEIDSPAVRVFQTWRILV
jgi:hypothetical protein